MEQALHWWGDVEAVVGIGGRVYSGSRWIRRKSFPPQRNPDTMPEDPVPEEHGEKE